MCWQVQTLNWKLLTSYWSLWLPYLSLWLLCNQSSSCSRGSIDRAIFSIAKQGDMHLSIHLCLVGSVPAVRAGCQVPFFLACFLFSQPQFIALRELWTVVGLVAVKICPNNIWIHNLTCVESDDFPLKEVDLCNWMCIWWWKKFQTTDWQLISMLHENCWHTVMCAWWCYVSHETPLFCDIWSHLLTTLHNSCSRPLHLQEG